MNLPFLLSLVLLPASSGFCQDDAQPSRPSPAIEKAPPRPSFPLIERTFKAGLTPDQLRALGGHAALDQMAAAMTPEQKARVRQQLDAARAEAATPEALKEIAQGYLLLDEHGPQTGQNVLAIGEQLRALEPKKSDGYTITAEGHYRMGDYPAAAEQARRAWEMSGRTDTTALTILKMSEGRTAAVQTLGATTAPAPAPDGVTVAGADFTIPENNDISPQAMIFVRQATAARRTGDMAKTWSNIQAAMNADPTSTEVQKLYAFVKEDRLKYTDTKDYLRQSREAMDAGHGEEAVAWAQRAADRSGDSTVRAILELTKQRSAKLAKTSTQREAPGMPLWPIGAGLGLAATAYGIYRSKQTWASEDGLDPAPEVSPAQVRSNYLKTAAVAGTAFVALAAWEFGPGAFAAARAMLSVSGPGASGLTPALAGGGAAGGEGVALNQAAVGAAKVAGTTLVLVEGTKAISDRVSYAKAPTGDGSLEPTKHGSERLSDLNPTRGGVLSSDEAKELKESGRVLEQRDGGKVYLREVEPGKFDVYVENSEGKPVTSFRHVRPNKLQNLARNYGWYEAPGKP